MKTIRSMAVIVGCGLMAVIPVFPCTTFVLQDGGHIYFGRNLDWHWETGWVVANQHSVKKTALVAPDRSPAKWTSKYGSITFNQFGQEEPYGGMNEAGLVVEQMMLTESKYPATDSRPEIGPLQWIQYQLDTCATIAEVVATDTKIRPQPTSPAAIHYLVADAAGDSATIEWLDGKMICHRGASLPSHALANDSYAQSVAFARTHPTPVTVTEPLKDPSSFARFACAASRAAGFQSRNPEADLAYAFETLDQVRQGEFTVWQIVYDITARRIHYRTLSNPRTRTLDLNTLNFDCARAVKFANITASPSSTGSIDLQDLSEGRHRQYLQEFLSQESLKKVLGDLTPMLEPLLLSVRNNGCATAPRSPAQGSNLAVERAFAAWNSHDVNRMAAAYSDDVIYEDVPFDRLSNGPVEFRAWVAECFSIIGDFKIEATNTAVENGHGVVEWVWSGVDKDWFKTGKPFSIRGVSVIEIRDGKISRNKDFYDGAAILRQIGKLPE